MMVLFDVVMGAADVLFAASILNFKFEQAMGFVKFTKRAIAHMLCCNRVKD